VRYYYEAYPKERKKKDSLVVEISGGLSPDYYDSLELQDYEIAVLLFSLLSSLSCDHTSLLCCPYVCGYKTQSDGW
jgi:hypothetical protein